MKIRNIIFLMIGLFSIVSFTHAVETVCPFGLVNDPAPGQCGLYTDQNNDQLCDLSQGGTPEINHEDINHVCEGDIGEYKVNIEGSKLKTMTVQEVAEIYKIDTEALVSALTETLGTKIGKFDLIQNIHDEYEFGMKDLKLLAESLMGKEYIISLGDQIKNFLKAIHLGLLFVIIIILALIQLLTKKTSLNDKKIFNILSYIVLPIGSMFWVVYAMYMQLDKGFIFDAGRQLGYICLWLFFIIMFVKPLCVLLKKGIVKSFSTFIMQFRRQLGILVFWIALAHTLVYILYIIANTLNFWNFFNLAALIAGFIGLVTLLIGFLTSNDWSIRKFSTHWKKIQMAAYPALLASIIHVIFIAPDRGYVLLGLFVVYGVLKVFEWRKKD